MLHQPVDGPRLNVRIDGMPKGVLCKKKPRSRRSQEEPGCTNFNRLLQCVKDVAENHKIVTLGCSSLKTVEICGQIFNLPSLEDLGLDRQRWLTPRIVEGFQVP